MKALIQRVQTASVRVDGEICGQIGSGLLIFLGIHQTDGSKEVEYLVNKIVNLRVFETEKSGFDLSVLDEKKELLVVSQFTLYGNCEKGRRPDFNDAANPDLGKKCYNEFVEKLRQTGLKVSTGQFQAHMEVELINDGPVTMMIESK